MMLHGNRARRVYTPSQYALLGKGDYVGSTRSGSSSLPKKVDRYRASQGPMTKNRSAAAFLALNAGAAVCGSIESGAPETVPANKAAIAESKSKSKSKSAWQATFSTRHRRD